ncbi:MAG: Hvo_1808 family surface protein [Haloarculaceae archaeon]
MSPGAAGESDHDAGPAGGSTRDGAGRRGVTRGVGVLAVALLVVLSGCTFGASFVEDRAPAGETLGWEGGYRYDDPLSVNTSDGLNASEREAVVARTMARVERIRGLEFTDPVPVEVISRAAFRERRNGSDPPGEAYGRWNDQVWEAAFLVGEDTSVAEVFDAVYSTSVVGFYSPGEDRIVVVSDAATPTLDRATLAHELVHALQDQHLSFGAGGGTQDAALAEDGLVEGDANAVEAAYEARCGSEWDCIPRPERSGGGGGGSFDRGVFLTVYAPYAAGPGFVGDLRARSDGNWTAVNDAYGAFPESTEQVIHPEAYPDERPANATVPDRSDDRFDRFDLKRETDTVGEATVYATFRANGVLPDDHPTYVYDQRLSAGWGGDTVVPYRGADGEDAYVWRTVWDTERDAREFLEGYRALLAEHDAVERGDGVYVVESGPFADAFRVVRRGETVTVVNAPTVEDLDSVHAPR